MDLLDETTTRVIGVRDVLAAARPHSEYAREFAVAPRTFRSRDREAWRVEQSLIRELEAWWSDQIAARAREAFGHLPTLQRSLLVLESGEVLDDTGLFELKRFLYWAHRLVQVTTDDVTLVQQPWGEALAGLMQQVHPEEQLSPRFRLSPALDPRLAAARELLKKSRGAERSARAELEAELLEAHGGRFDVQGLLVAEGDVVDARLVPHGAGRYSVADPELGALVSAVDDAEESCAEIEHSVRKALSDTLRPHVAWLREVRESLALLDTYCARVDLRREWGGCWPSWGDRLSLEAARHPRLIADCVDEVQPIDVEIGLRPTIVTGPNMGGKSMLLKLVGMAQWLAQHGFPVPATGCTFRPVESIVYVGSDESGGGEGGLSSFGREVRRVVDSSAPEAPILWLLDEFGRGTHPEEGAGIARDFIRQRYQRGDVVVAATHFPSLARLDDAAHLQIAGISHPEALGALGPDPSVAEVETALRSAMEYRPIVRSAEDQDVPRDARLVARALGLDVDEQ